MLSHIRNWIAGFYVGRNYSEGLCQLQQAPVLRWLQTADKVHMQEKRKEAKCAKRPSGPSLTASGDPR